MCQFCVDILYLGVEDVLKKKNLIPFRVTFQWRSSRRVSKSRHLGHQKEFLDFEVRYKTNGRYTEYIRKTLKCQYVFVLKSEQLHWCTVI